MNESTVAYMTLDEEGSPSMLFFDRQEALKYCHTDETPIELVARASQSAPSPVGDKDGARMEWLVSKTVNVREHLRYGSRNIFWAGPEEGDGEIIPSDLRVQIDRALAQEGTKK